MHEDLKIQTIRQKPSNAASSKPVINYCAISWN